MVAEISRDRKYIKRTLVTTFSGQKKNNNKEANDDFTLHTKTSARCYILNTRTY